MKWPFVTRTTFDRVSKRLESDNRYLTAFVNQLKERASQAQFRLTMTKVENHALRTELDKLQRIIQAQAKVK